MRKENKNKKKKIDKMALFTKVVAGLLVGFTVAGTCYTLIYFLINS